VASHQFSQVVCTWKGSSYVPQLYSVQELEQIVNRCLPRLVSKCLLQHGEWVLPQLTNSLDTKALHYPLAKLAPKVEAEEKVRCSLLPEKHKDCIGSHFPDGSCTEDGRDTGPREDGLLIGFVHASS